ncbi:hypothetical protein SLEP1_g19715 [Rubroshorea leprosula]|uniref:Uncharacterized protein n=1 Tax=Rubroshorea leprosula TaxID=152421 RepID=A0AAV5JAW9_9ROSI|nr:hypothetical protein SLEP1_g19715 [Rubroshorea leprosula]
MAGGSRQKNAAVERHDGEHHQVSDTHTKTMQQRLRNTCHDVGGIRPDEPAMR